MSVRKAIESLYTGRMTVINSVETTDPQTGVSSFEDREIYTDIPCRLSFSSVKQGAWKNETTQIEQAIKIFCAPELDIRAGSKITVTQNGRTQTYEASGEAEVHSVHQEIALKMYKERA